MPQSRYKVRTTPQQRGDRAEAVSSRPVGGKDPELSYVVSHIQPGEVDPGYTPQQYTTAQLRMDPDIQLQPGDVILVPKGNDPPPPVDEAAGQRRAEQASRGLQSRMDPTFVPMQFAVGQSPARGLLDNVPALSSTQRLPESVRDGMRLFVQSMGVLVEGHTLQPIQGRARFFNAEYKCGVFKMTQREAVEMVEAAHTVSSNQLLALCGPVLLVHDQDGKPVANTKRRILTVSTPAIDFRQSNSAFVTHGVVNKTGKARMRDIWRMVLASFSVNEVRYPVLTPIGCGAFRGHPKLGVPGLWADALVTVLAEPYDWGFSAVLVSVLQETTFTDFWRTLQSRKDELTEAPPVVLTRVHDALELARTLPDAGLLVPCDDRSVREGSIGGKPWVRGAPIGFEEVVALRTTLLLQNKGLNPKLWTEGGNHLEYNGPQLETDVVTRATVRARSPAAGRSR